MRALAKADSVGGTCHRKKLPPPVRFRAKIPLTSPSGFPLGKPDPQGGSEPSLLGGVQAPNPLCQGFGQARRPVPTVAAPGFLDSPSPLGFSRARICPHLRVAPHPRSAQNTPRPASRERVGFSGREREGAPGERGVSETMRLRRRRFQAPSEPARRVVTEREDAMRRPGSPAIPGARRGRTGTPLRPPRELLKNKINIDKFTGFFDKFLKISDRLNDCNKKSYHSNLSAGHSNTAAKKVFQEPAHFPATARISSRTASRRQSLIHQSALTRTLARIRPRRRAP